MNIPGSRRRRGALTVLLGTCLGLCGGCLSARVEEAVVEASLERVEFRARYGKVDGSYAGTVEVDGERWHQFEFPGVLAGEGGRLLVVYIADSAEGGALRLRVTDCTEASPPLGPARLEYAVHDEGTAIPRGPFEPGDGARRPHRVGLGICRSGGAEFAIAEWLPPGAYDWRPRSGEIDLSWEERSRLEVFLLGSLYLPALAVDVVVVPIGMVLLIPLCLIFPSLVG
jgi:hypothetical protein